MTILCLPEISDNVMNAAWGTMQERDTVVVNLTETHKTVQNIKARGAFTVSIADAAHIVEADYFGVESGNKVTDKFARSGLTASKAETVDPAECFHPKPKVNSVLIKLTRHTTDVPDKYWKLYTYFVSKWVNREYRQLFTKNQFHQAMKHAKVNNLSTVTYEQVLSIFNSYLLFNGRK